MREGVSLVVGGRPDRGRGRWRGAAADARRRGVPRQPALPRARVRRGRPLPPSSADSTAYRLDAGVGPALFPAERKGWTGTTPL